MALDLEQTLSWTKSLAAAGPSAAAERAMLGDLQGNILKGHGRRFTSNLFLSFPGGGAARRFVAGIGRGVTSALDQLKDARAHKATGRDGGLFVAFFLSAAGYRALGLEAAMPASEAFAAGMKARARLLADPSPAHWDAHLAAELHAMVLLGASSAAARAAAHAAFVGRIESAGAAVELLGWEHGGALFNADKNGIEHFGYVDGRSQPLPLQEDVDAEAGMGGIDRWNPAIPLRQLLVQCPGGELETSHGSYFVFRKLEQSVRGFKQRAIDLAEHLGAAGEFAGASVMGRFENGTPVTLAPTEIAVGANGDAGVPNNFDYLADAGGFKCPFAGHIRKTNPRGDSAGSKDHLMARRGIPYGVRVDDPNDGKIANKPTGNVGLLFMSYQSDLEQQFEFTQRLWANNADFGRPATGIDPVIGQPPATVPQRFPDNHGVSLGAPFDFSGFVNLRGGEYFFAPSISFLKTMKA